MSQQKPTSLNPGASEFVPNFTLPNMSNLSLGDNNEAAEPQYQPQANNEGKQQKTRYHQNNYNQQQGYYQQQQQQQQQSYNNNQSYQYYGQNNNNSHRHTYNPNPNYRGNNYNANHRNKHYHYNNNNNNQHYNGYHYNQQHQQQQGYDVDPIELEARCEAVIEILQDDKIREQLNPVPADDQRSTQIQDSNNNNQNSQQNDPQYDDEEELLEMMAMQEECRLEMMKFYIQSQNPTLFEEIYHDVSYPDSVKQVPEDELKSPKVAETSTTTATTTTESSSSSSPSTEQTETADNNTLRDLIINELNPDVAEFVPIKYSNETESNPEAAN